MSVTHESVCIWVRKEILNKFRAFLKAGIDPNNWTEEQWFEFIIDEALLLQIDSFETEEEGK